MEEKEENVLTNSEEPKILEPSEKELQNAEKNEILEQKCIEKIENEVSKSNPALLNTNRWIELEKILATGSIKIWEALNISKEAYEKIKNNNERILFEKPLFLVAF